MSRTPSPQKRMEELREQVQYHNARYHGHDDPEISDAEFDELARELRQLEIEHPELVDDSSPSLAVGAAAITTFD